MFDDKYREERCYWGKKPSKIVESLLEYKSSGSVLDLGAGEGRNSIFLAKKGFDVTAVDISKIGIEKLEELALENRVKVKTSVEDIRDYNFREDYDVILSIATLHFLKEGDIRGVVDDIKNHTNKSGLNVISVFTEDNPNKGFPHLFRKEELKQFYSDWQILSYREFLSPKEKHGEKGEWHRHRLATLIARKA